MLKGKKIVLGITGSIAAYKACLIIRQLVKQGAEVQVVITPAGKEFITPITLSALTSKPVISEFFAQRDGTWHSHVDLGLWADAMLIAPCTASTIGKMAHGVADNMLITTYLSMKAPVFVAPAMDLDMYRHHGLSTFSKAIGNMSQILLNSFLLHGVNYTDIAGKDMNYFVYMLYKEDYESALSFISNDVVFNYFKDENDLFVYLIYY